MISLETAKKLKEAGLNDIYTDRGPLITINYGLGEFLEEIEKRGYWWELTHGIVDNGINKYRVTITKKHNTSIPIKTFEADSPEEAAAQALLWILEQEVKTDVK